MIYDNTVLIPTNYWDGHHTLDLEIPWITPEALHSLYLFLKPYHSVLEFGSGGSTLFFSKRSKSVLSFETLAPWYGKMKSKLDEGRYQNVTLNEVSTLEECTQIIGDRKFDVTLIDICGISRTDLARLALLWTVPGGLVLVDNYGADYCRGIDELYGHCKKNTFDDSHWSGNGTRTYYIPENPL